jgi:hypothetical protein
MDCFTDREDGFGNLVVLSRELRADVLSLAHVEIGVFTDLSSLLPTIRRHMTRSVFAFIEAITFAIKQAAVELDAGKLSHCEVTLAKEQHYELRNGTAKMRPARLTLKDNVQFAFCLFAKAAGIANVLNVSGNNWQRFLSVIKVRDRLMHPKTPADILVSDGEVHDVGQVFRWFDYCFATTLYLHIAQQPGLQTRPFGVLVQPSSDFAKNSKCLSMSSSAVPAA